MFFCAALVILMIIKLLFRKGKTIHQILTSFYPEPFSPPSSGALQPHSDSLTNSITYTRQDYIYQSLFLIIPVPFIDYSSPFY